MAVNRDKSKEEILIEPQNLELLAQYTSQGMKTKDICKDVFNISTAFFYHVCARHPEVKEAYYKGLQKQEESINHESQQRRNQN